MSEPKDCWDKLDIAVKPIIALVAVGTLFLWNDQRTKMQTSATMTQIAVGVLSEEPDAETNAIREWAIEVLQNPEKPPGISDTVAKQLRLDGLPLSAISKMNRSFPSFQSSKEIDQKIEEAFRKLNSQSME